MYTLGIDIGSTTSKCVILEDGRTIVAKSLVKAGTGTSGPDGAYNEVLHSAGLTQDEIAFTMATGYGRKTYPAADAEMSELSCHGKGVFLWSRSAVRSLTLEGQGCEGDSAFQWNNF